jgi:hypothetical protein
MPAITVDRRKEERFLLRLPIKARIAECISPFIAELTDVSASGARCDVRGDADTLHVDDCVAFGFVVPGWPKCQAKGQIVRIERPRTFGMAIDDTNEAFNAFIRLLASKR